MASPIRICEVRVQRVRAILITPEQQLLFIKRVKPHKPKPYWVAPGGGVEPQDNDLYAALDRELCEELGAKIRVVAPGFILTHEKVGKQLEEHFYICRLLGYDLTLRHGPEFDDPSRGEYIPDCVPMRAQAIAALNIRTVELQTWLLDNLNTLRGM